MISNYQLIVFPKALPPYLPPYYTLFTNMSAPIEQVVLNEQIVLTEETPIVEEVKDKKPKKPTLPAKHAKFMQFGSWFAQLLLESGDIDSALFDKIRAKLTVFDDFHPQMSFYSAFADQHKDFNKSLRKEIVAHHRAIAKANKPPPKSKKSPLSDKSQSDFIANIISDAQSSLPLTPEPPSPSPSPSPKAPTPSPSPSPKAPKQKLQKKSTPSPSPTPTPSPTPEVLQLSLDSTTIPTESKADKPPKQPKEKTPKKPEPPQENTLKEPELPKEPKQPKEKTPKAPKEPKPPKAPKATKKSAKPEQPVVPVTATSTDEDEELDVRPFIINGVNYLIDDQNNLYNPETHDEVGTFNPSTNAVTLL